MGLFARVAEGNQAARLAQAWIGLAQMVQSTLFACMDEMSWVEPIVFQTGRPARARPEPDLARPYAARHYTARLMFRAGPCRASCLAGGPGTAL
jgi:hypothetical protein